MNWFSWLLVVVLGISIILRLCRLGGWKPKVNPNLAYIGIGMLADCFLVVGIFLWL